VREIEQPAGFLLTDKLFPVTVTENEQVIEVRSSTSASAAASR
jgi:hypothetical protein